MEIRCAVMQVVELPERDGKPSERPLTSVSLEGFSVLLKSGLEKPVPGRVISAVVSTQWREKGKRPIFWLTAWQEAMTL